MKSIFVKKGVAAAVGAVVFFILGRYITVPHDLPHFEYGVLAFVAAAYGPFAGLAAGFAGELLIDLSFRWGVWWSWVITSAFFGCAVGVCSGRLAPEGGALSRKDIIVFNIVQAIANILSWAVLAPILDVAIYSEPAGLMFTRGLARAGTSILATAVAGTLLLLVYARVSPGEGGRGSRK